jgi:hypothetical protein
MRKGCVVVEIKKWKAKKGVGRRKGMSNWMRIVLDWIDERERRSGGYIGLIKRA